MNPGMSYIVKILSHVIAEKDEQEESMFRVGKVMGEK